MATASTTQGLPAPHPAPVPSLEPSLAPGSARLRAYWGDLVALGLWIVGVLFMVGMLVYEGITELFLR